MPLRKTEKEINFCPPFHFHAGCLRSTSCSVLGKSQTPRNSPWKLNMFVTKDDTVGKVTSWLSLTSCYRPHFGYKGSHKTHILTASIPTKLHTIETKMRVLLAGNNTSFSTIYIFSSSFFPFLLKTTNFFQNVTWLDLLFPQPPAQNTVSDPDVLIFLPHLSITMYSIILYTRLTTARP